MLSRVSKSDAVVLAGLISLGIMTIIGAVVLARAISFNALKSDAHQLATHWAQYIAAEFDKPDGFTPGRDIGHHRKNPRTHAPPGLPGGRAAIHDHLPNTRETIGARLRAFTEQVDPRSFHSGSHVSIIDRYGLFAPDLGVLALDPVFSADEIERLIRTPAFADTLRAAMLSGETIVENLPPDSMEGHSHIARVYVPIAGRGGPAGVMVVDIDQSASLALLGGAFNVIVIIMAALMLLGIATPVFAIWRRIRRRQADLESQVDFMAIHDPLTELPNRNQFTRCLDTALENARRNRSCVALLTADIDRFHNINDTLGYPAGDALLVAIAARFREASMNCDAVAARLGGDEFAIAVQGRDARENALMLARVLRDSTAETDIRAQRKLSTTLSIGMAIGPADGADALTLIKHADMALTRAKAAGAGSTRLYVSSMEAETQSRYALERDLRHALKHNELRLLYQPQVSLLSGEVTGYEALLRWRHPRRGEIPPGEFIGYAEESGLIGEIGEWVLATACRTAAGWPEPLKVAVNLSAVQFMSGDIVQIVEETLARTGLNPARLEIEVTDTLLLHHIEKVQHALRRLNALGVAIAVDDFGTGYSSRSDLASFPFQKIKMDRSFVIGLGKSREALAVIRAIIGLGKALNATVIAEGVETKEQVGVLRTAGCTNVQGYLYGKPAEKILDPWAATVAIAHGERRMTNTG